MSQLIATGELGKAVFGSRTLNLSGWSYKATGKANDTTNSGTAGVETSHIGTVKYTGTIKGQWDLNDQPSPGIYPGARGLMNLYTSSENYIAFTEVELQELSVDSEVEGLVTWSATWQGQAAPTMPTDPAFSSSSSSSSSSQTV